MIRYSLVCERKHVFEVWFKNSADYDKQSKRGLVSCPSCGSEKVEKALMAPSLGRSTRKGRSSSDNTLFLSLVASTSDRCNPSASVRLASSALPAMKM